MGFSEFWNEASDGKKAVTIIVSCCCVGLILCVALVALIMPDLNTLSEIANDDEINDLVEDVMNNTTNNTTAFIDNLEDMDDDLDNDSDDDLDDDLQVKITTKGKWSAHIGDQTTSKAYEGKGNKKINIHKDYDVIGVAVQKETDDTEPLKVEIIDDGKVVSKEKTSEKYGVVSLSASV